MSMTNKEAKELVKKMPSKGILNKLKKFCCWIGWHSLNGYENAHHHPGDPLQFLVFAKCKWCGYEGQIDSQGNLF